MHTKQVQSTLAITNLDITNFSMIRSFNFVIKKLHYFNTKYIIMTSFEAKKRRRVINDVERKTLRKYYHDQFSTNEDRSSGKDTRH